MIARGLTLGLVGAAALAVARPAPAQQTEDNPYWSRQPPASDQSAWAQPQDRDLGPEAQPRSDQPEGGYYYGYEAPDQASPTTFTGYPEFRRFEGQIHQEIRQGVSQNLIDPDDARDLMAQLRDIRRREVREFQEHGWNLPPDVRHDIRTDLADLDRNVAEAWQKG